MATGAPGANSNPVADYVLVLVLAMVAIGLSITGVFLLVTCEAAEFTDQFGYTTLGCTYPFQNYGRAFLYAASLVVTLELFPIHSVLLARGHHPIWSPSHTAVVTFAGLTLFFFIVEFLL